MPAKMPCWLAMLRSSGAGDKHKRTLGVPPFLRNASQPFCNSYLFIFLFFTSPVDRQFSISNVRRLRLLPTDCRLSDFINLFRSFRSFRG